MDLDCIDIYTDSVARTVRFSNLTFDSTVPRRIRYQYPFRDIYYDLDGILTGKRPGTWDTNYWHHNAQSECTVDLFVYDGINCYSTV